MLGQSSGQGWVGEVTIAIFAFWRGAGREPREENFWATTLWNPFFVTMLMCHV